MAAAIKEGHTGPIFIQGDHYQADAKKYKTDPEGVIDGLKKLIREAVAAGYANIDIDTSTLVDLAFPTLAEQQRHNYERCAELAALIREIRTPSEWITPEFETVTVVTKDGQRIRGVKKNEDVFSIQVMDTRERIQGYMKSNLQDILYDKTSLMPVFDPGRLSDGDLNDVVGYLSSLRGADLSAR